MPQLDKIEIRGFKSIKSTELELCSLNVLIGANGAGKSNFISAFKFLRELVSQNLQVQVARSGGASDLLYRGQQVTDQLYFCVDFKPQGGGRNSYSCTLIPSVDDNFVFESEVAYFHGSGHPNPYHVPLGFGHLETELHSSTERVAKYVRKAMDSWRIYHFHDTSESSKLKQVGAIDDNSFLRPDASNLAAYLYLLQETEPDSYQKIVEVIRLIAPFFKDFVLRPNPLSKNTIRLEWSERGSDTYYNAHSLSDGTLRFVSLVTLLLQPDYKFPTTILLDEPELGLHPYAITVLAGLLKSVSVRTQIIISTQSVTLVDQFAPEDIVVVDREDEQSVFRRLPTAEIENWLEDYSLGEIWEKNIIKGRPSV